jgi:hypothetical protein
MKPLKLIVFISMLIAHTSVFAQYSVTEIVTDFSGYWKSGTLSINGTKPNNSHNLLSFTFNNKRYSTGVNDAALTSNGLTYIPADFKALPMQSITGVVNNNTKVGLGELYDGVSNGASNPPPENDIPKYLNDGIKGLDIGTCIANLPAGGMIFPISNMRAASINDGNPDLLITQTADPSVSKLDRYEFVDINGNRVGNAVDIVLVNIAPVGTYTADFYEANSRPMTLLGGYRKTDRAIRLWAADFSSFGINASNIAQIAYFKITLSGESDVAFVAYNDATFDITTTLLPINLLSFTANSRKSAADLAWKTSAEFSSARFVVEASTNGASFVAVDSLKAAGNSSITRSYNRTINNLSNGKWYFRLKMVDADGNFSYSAIQQVIIGGSSTAASIFPNPATSYTVLRHAAGSGNETVDLYSMTGALVKSQKVQANAIQTTVQLAGLAKGVYQVRYNDGVAPKSFLVTVQ